MAENGEVDILSPDYLRTNLAERLKAVDLSDSERQDIVGLESINIIKDAFLNLSKIGQIANTFLNWNEKINEALEQAKKERLLELYIDKCESNENAINDIIDLLCSPQGNILFNKILRILKNEPPDESLFLYLANSLKHIVENDFEDQFQEHKSVLSQLEELSPQALTILINQKKWPVTFSAQGTVSPNGVFSSEWITGFVENYIELNKLQGSSLKISMSYAVNELLQHGHIFAQVLGSDIAMPNLSPILGKDKAMPKISPVGRRLLKYIGGVELG